MTFYNNNRTKVIEHFGVGGINIKNTNTTLTETQITNLIETTKDIDESMMIQNCAKLIKSAINEVVNKNQSALLQALAASNNISMSNATIKGDLNVTAITQANTVDITANANFAQKVKNDITTQITDEVSKTFVREATNAASMTSGSNIGETLGKAMDAISNIGESFIEGATDVINGSLTVNKGNETTETTRSNNETKLIDTFKLNSSFQLTANEDFNNAVSNQLSTENLSNCNQEAKANNDLNLSNIDVGGNANLNDIKQINFVTAALNCAFNQDICNQLASIFVTNYNNLVKSMIENKTINNEGDIAAAGTAGSAFITAGGAAISDAAQGVGSGVSEGAQGIGSGVGNTIGAIGSALAMNPVFILICCCVLLVLLAAGGAYFMMNKEKIMEQVKSP